MRRTFFCLLLISILSVTVLAQQQQPQSPKLQTPRQALIEIITKGGDSVLKHLTVEVQEMFLKPENKAAAPMLTALTSMKPEKGLQTFEAGDVLVSFAEPGQNMKYEVRVDDDDMAGTEDTLSLSLHVLRDGKEEDSGMWLLSSHFSVNMKQQQNIWRLNKISVGADFPIGDPEFIKKNLLHSDTVVHTTGMTAMVGGTGTAPAQTQPASMPPEQLVAVLGFAESTFARQHPETGFTCSLAELGETAKLLGVDQQVSTGSYNGYHIGLSGCEGKPASSYQVFVEPISAGRNSKAFCSDATQNLRVLEGGNGTNCLGFGKPQSIVDEGGMGWDPISAARIKPETEEKPK
jgi:hypothetical protein